MPMTRRFLLRTCGAGAVLAPLVALFGHEAEGAVRMGRGYGLLKPRLPLNTRDVYARRADGGLAFDYRGVPLLSLPPHFRYHVLSCTGQPMSDGGRVPGDHDGMACFPAPGGGYILLRNHELNLREAKFGSREGVVVAPELRYDSFANGGVTTLVLDAQGQLVRHFAALGGTNNNCSGGPTPWGSWLTCEESTALPADGSYTRRHGYVFEVPADARGPVPAEPLVDMGRFAHEAAATDPRTGTVYMTEDREDGLFYRFVPNRPGELRAGGRLQALRLAGRADDDVHTSLDPAVRSREPQAVDWVDIAQPDPPDNAPQRSTRVQGRALGAVRFARGEGAHFGNGQVYFCCTTGGAAQAGQVFVHDPRSGTLGLVVESRRRSLIDAPDSITVGPDGTLYLSEDGGRGNGILGVDRQGHLFTVARNSVNGSEFCGGTFSPDGRFLFVNMQTPGLTLAIEGPWDRRAAGPVFDAAAGRRGPATAPARRT